MKRSESVLNLVEIAEHKISPILWVPSRASDAVVSVDAPNVNAGEVGVGLARVVWIRIRRVGRHDEPPVHVARITVTLEQFSRVPAQGFVAIGRRDYLYAIVFAAGRTKAPVIP